MVSELAILKAKLLIDQSALETIMLKTASNKEKNDSIFKISKDALDMTFDNNQRKLK